MTRVVKKFNVELNSEDNLRDLLQEIIELSNEQLIQIQAEINKLANATDLTQEGMDGKAKYAKAINDFMTIKDKTVAKKIDVARMLQEVLKHNGNIDDSVDSSKGKSFDITKLRAMVDETISKKEESSDTKTITLKKPK